MDSFEFHQRANEALRVGFAGEVTTATTDATAQKLVPIQGSQFIRVTMSRSKFLGLIPDKNKIEINTPQIKLPRVTRTRPRTSAGLGETAVVADANYFEVAFDERNATPKAHELGLKMSRRFTLDNVERSVIESTLESEAGDQFQEDLEYSALLGDTAGSDPAVTTPGLGTTINGFSKKLQTSATTKWADGAYIGENLLNDIVGSLPVENRPDGVIGVKSAGFEFYAPVQVVDSWRLRVSKRLTDAGDMALLEDGRLGWAGIPINGVPLLPVNLDGVAGHAVSNVASTFCEIWLAQPERFYVYYNPVLFIHRGVDVETGKKIYYYLYAAMDVQLDIPERCVIARDVRPTRDTTAW